MAGGAGPGKAGAGPLGRLTRRAEFLAVAAARRKWAGPGLVLQVRPRDALRPEGEPEMRVGFTASRKVGNAVTRNRARRRLRALARAVLPALAEPGYDYVLIARPETATLPFAELDAGLRRGLGRLGVRRPDAERSGAAPPG